MNILQIQNNIADRIAVREYEGIGGILLLVAAGLIITPVRLVLGCVNTFAPVFSNNGFTAFTTPESEVYSPLWLPLLFYEFFAQMIFIVLSTSALILFFKRKRNAPGLIIIYLLTNVVYLLFDRLAVCFLPHAVNGGGFDESLSDIGFAVLTCLIWIPYFIKSFRVKKTFIN